MEPVECSRLEHLDLLRLQLRGRHVETNGTLGVVGIIEDIELVPELLEVDSVGSVRREPPRLGDLAAQLLRVIEMLLRIELALPRLIDERVRAHRRKRGEERRREIPPGEQARQIEHTRNA